MNRIIKIEHYEEHEKVHFYTIQFEGEETEFDKFLDAFPEDSEYKEDIDIIIKWIDKIGRTGAVERYFRPEGKYTDGIFAIPLEICKIRLYLIRISDEIVILGNGGIKTSKTYNEDQTLEDHVKLLQIIERLLKGRIKREEISIYSKNIYGNVDFTINQE